MKDSGQKRKAGTRPTLKKYRVSILPTFGPVEVEAENPEGAEELANHYWDMDWGGEFVTQVGEVSDHDLEGGRR